jgi:transposase
MRSVELYSVVRRAVYNDGLSQREAARRFGVSRETVAKMLRFSVPPGYRRQSPPRRPKLEPFIGVIDQILADDAHRSRKQRHTARHIFERLRDEYGFEGGYTIVKDYLREKRLGSQEVFVPLAHSPGHAQVDFGEAAVVIGGVECKAHYFVMALPHSDDVFVMAFPGETTEAFCQGHNQAFAYFGGVPRSIVYDNSKIAVARILGDGTRTRTRAFSELQSHYLFEDRFARPARGNDKGKVEGLVGYARRNFFVSPALPISIGAWKSNAASGVPGVCGATSKASPSGSHKTRRPSCRCLPRPMTPVTESPPRRLHSPWCVMPATTIRCPPPTATARCWSRVMWTQW